jgi:AbrB family looped-hinge helix DNA binding protein
MAWTVSTPPLIWWHFCHFPGILDAMETTIDAAGRIVVPKALRQALGLQPGQPLEIRASEGVIEISVAPTPMQLRKRGKGVVAVPEATLPALTSDIVRETLERTRR